MERLTRLILSLALAFALATTALAGEVLTPPCAPPDPGEVLTPPCAAAQQASDDESAAGQTITAASENSTDFLSKAALELLGITLSVF